MKNDLPDLNDLKNAAADVALLASACDGACHAGRLMSIMPDGGLMVELSTGEAQCCDVLLRAGAEAPSLQIDDRVLVVSLSSEPRGVVLGCIGRYSAPQSQPQVTIEATESLTLKCGQAQLQMRADGKVLIKGEDVTVRAQGTHRIRAGTVAIN